MDRVHMEQAAVSRSDAVSRQAARRWFEDELEYASGVRSAAMGTSLSRKGEGDGHRSGDEEVCAVRYHGQEVCNKLHEPVTSSTREAGYRFLVAGLATGADDQAAGCKSHLVAQLCALHRSTARGQAALAFPSLGRTRKSSLPDW